MEKQRKRTFARWALALTLSVAGLATGVVTADSAAADSGTFSNSGVIAIPAVGLATPYPSGITVAGLAGTITDVNVTLTGFAHSRPDNVGVVLVAPNNDALLLMDGPGGGETLAGSINLTFDDSAATQMPNTGAITGGTWKPTAHYTDDSFNAPGPLLAYGHPGPAGGNTATLASMFNGDPANGSWNLYIKDFSNPETGSISGGWSLSITTNLNTLTVATAGTGTGTVSGAGINCPGDCADGYAPGTSVPLTATPAVGSTFAGWSGACTGTGACDVSMTQARSVTATFALNTYSLTAVTAGTGAGTVTGTGISCPGDCTETYNHGTNVSLTATPAVGSTFAGWSGACTGTGACDVSMTQARSVSASFSVVPDTTAPDTTVTKGPQKRTFKKKASFTFTSNEAGVTFQCSIDGKAYAACTSPMAYKHLKKGKHTFSVRAIDRAGNTDASPATYSWKVKKPR